MPQKLLLYFRVALVVVAVGLLAFLLWRGGLTPQLRIVLVAALVFYVVRLWLTVSKMRQRGPETNPPEGDDG